MGPRQGGPGSLRGFVPPRGGVGRSVMRWDLGRAAGFSGLGPPHGVGDESVRVPDGGAKRLRGAWDQVLPAEAGASHKFNLWLPRVV